MSVKAKGFGFLMLAILSVFFYSSSFNEFPQHIHGWSQSDRYALAIGFLNNGFDFFHPQTFNLNVQFEPIGGLKSYTGITAVDFPFNEFLVALLMKIFGVNPWVFKSFILLYVCLGLFFVAELCMRFNSNPLWAWLCAVFIFTTPVFTYYANGFLPGMSAWSNAAIGFYFYSIFLQQRQFKPLALALAFFVLAALCRTPFIMCLLAIGFVECVHTIKIKRIDISYFACFILGFILIVLYATYNTYLRKIYGSVFLNTPMPARNWVEFKQIAWDIYRQWGMQYFTLCHYLVWLFAFVFLAIAILKFKLAKWQQQFVLIQFVLLLGATCYALLMWRQMQQHDYYFVDTFLLPLALLFVVAMGTLPKISKPIQWITVLSLTVLFAFKSKQVQALRNDSGPWDRYHTSVKNFEGTDAWLSQNKVSPQARILVIDAYAPNMPFILMNRKGFSVITTSFNEIERALEYPFDYMVLQNQFVPSDVLPNYPGLQDRFECIASNGKVSLYKKSEVIKGQSLSAFLGFGKRTAKAIFNLNVDKNQTMWQLQATPADVHFADSLVRVAYADSACSYPVTLTLNAPQQFNLPQTFLVDMDVYAVTSFKDVFFSTYAGHDTVVSYQDYVPLLPQATKPMEWHKFSALIHLPTIKVSDEIRLFLWNPKGQKFYFKNCIIKQWQ